MVLHLLVVQQLLSRLQALGFHLAQVALLVPVDQQVQVIQQVQVGLLVQEIHWVQ